MKIGEFRAAVDSLNWNRRDLSGATRQEFVAMDVRTRLERHIVIVTGLLPLVHARFADDLVHATSAIESAQATIVRWEGYRPRPDPARRGALFGALPRGRWRMFPNSPRPPASWALRAGAGGGRSSRDDSRLVAHSLHSGCPGARHPFGAGLNPEGQAQRAALSFGPALRWLKCAAVRR